MSKRVIAKEGAWSIIQTWWGCKLNHDCEWGAYSASAMNGESSDLFVCVGCNESPPSNIEAMWHVANMCKPKVSVRIGNVQFTGLAVAKK